MFCMTGNKGLIIENKNRDTMAPNPTLLELRGKRCVLMSENNENEKLDKSAWKSLVGNDKQQCRALYSNNLVSFYPKCKILFLVNDPLLIDTSDSASVNRIFNICFDAEFKTKPQKGQYKQNPKLVNDLQTKYISETFSWIAKGAMMYYKNGIKENKLVNEMKESYLKKIDINRQFMEECMKPDPDTKSFIRRSSVRSQFKQFCALKESTRCINGKQINKLYELVSQKYTPSH